MVHEYSVLAYLLQNPEDWPRYYKHLLEGDPEDELCSYILHTVSKVYDDYQFLPKNPEELLYVLTRGGSDEANPVTLSLADKLFDRETISGIERLAVSDFLFSRRAKEIGETLSDLDSFPTSESLSNIIRDLEHLGRIAKDDEDDWIFPFSEEIMANPQQAVSALRGTPFRTGIPEFDGLLNGGWYREEQVVFVGLPGFGKSLTLLYMTLAGLIGTSDRAVYYGLDNSAADLIARTHAIISQEPMESDYGEALRSRCTFRRDQFIIRRWPRYQKGVRDIDADLDKVYDRFYESDRSRGIPHEEAGKARVFTVDYADVLAAPVGFRGEERHRLNYNYAGLAAIAEKRKITNLTASQANARGMGVKTMNMDNAAEAFAKSNHTSVMITLNQSAADFVANRMWLGMVKARRKHTRYRLPVIIDRERMSLYQDPDEDVQYLDIEEGGGPPRVRRKKADDGLVKMALALPREKPKGDEG